MSKYNVGIIGVGFGARVQVPGFRTVPGCEVVALCSRRRESVEVMAKKLGVPHAYTDYRDLLRIKDINAVSVVVPPYLHYPIVKTALEAGKHVLCEKPFVMNAAQAAELLLLARSRGLTHMIDHNKRDAPAWIAAKQAVDQGYLGRMHHVVCTGFFNRMLADRTPWGWLAEVRAGGGALGSVASHQIDGIRALFGDFAEVSANLSTAVIERPDRAGVVHRGDADDSVSVSFRLKSGASGAMYIGWAAQHSVGYRLEAYGLDGSMLLENDQVLKGARKEEKTLTELPVDRKRWNPVHTEGPFPFAFFCRLAQEFIESIETGDERSPSFEDGLRCQEVIDAIHESSRTGRRVKIHPA